MGVIKEDGQSEPSLKVVHLTHFLTQQWEEDIFLKNLRNWSLVPYLDISVSTLCSGSPHNLTKNIQKYSEGADVSPAAASETPKCKLNMKYEQYTTG